MRKAVMEFFLVYGGPLTEVSAALLVVVVTALLGLWAYFRQKEYELVRERYLENGIDLIVDQVATSLHQFQHNWTRAVLLLKTLRDLGCDTPAHLYSEPFPRSDPNAFLSTKHFQLQQLIRDTVFYDGCQLLTVFLHDATNTFENDLCKAVKVHIEGGKTHSITPEQRPEMVSAFIERLMMLEKEAQPYWVMLGKLQQISFVLERQRFTFRRLNRFHKHRAVVGCIKEVRGLLGEQIQEVMSLGESPRSHRDS